MTADPQHANQAIDTMSAITVTHVVLMAALAIAMVLVIWWGSRLSRRRKNARKQVEENFIVAEEHGAVTQPTISIDGTPTLSADVPEAQVASVGSAAEPAPAPTVLPFASDLTQIKGLGPKLATALAEHGITRVEQIAALTPQAAADLDARLGPFQGRMARDRWIEQAKLLSAGDRAGYEAAFGKLGG